MRFSPEIRWFLVAGLLTAGSSLACDDQLQLIPATNSNAVDTVTIYALRGTAVALPSGYDVPQKSAARTDVAQFDFAFDLDGGGESLIYPAGALGLERGPGILRADQDFDSLKTAPTTGYVDSVAVAVPPGTVFVVRSRPYLIGCELTGELPRYGKFRVLAVDPSARSLTLETLVNQNCGYRSLEPGLPTI
jgi:hypothetical protein